MSVKILVVNLLKVGNNLKNLFLLLEIYKFTQMGYIAKFRIEWAINRI